MRLALRLAGLTAAFAAPAAAAWAQPVVVELFESQGCSSCPPANANLAAITARPDVIALNFAVTYWNGPGWTDTFGTRAFTARQWDYAHAFHRPQVFTPQIVVDGRRDGVGIDPAEFARLVGRGSAAAATPILRLTAGAVTIGAAAAQAQPADVWLVRYDPRTLPVAIRGGENGGRTLPHKNIVKQLVRLGGWSGAAETLRLPRPPAPGLVDAVLVQTPRGGPILAAAKG
ncbi:MAG TPA: DUF1223 domain-containing protein [Caulobacteraceae bacterium]